MNASGRWIAERMDVYLASTEGRDDEEGGDVVIAEVLVPGPAIAGFDLVLAAEARQRRLRYVDSPVSSTSHSSALTRWHHQLTAPCFHSSINSAAWGSASRC